jgi:predicted metalloprotease with PDZ domain
MCCSFCYATYTVSYNDTQSTNIYINIQFTINKNIQFNLNGTQTFIMPRSIPSGYGLEFYDSYVDNLSAKTSDGSLIMIKKESTGGPRWTLECPLNKTLSTISYSIDLTKHEQGILSGGDSSKIRQGRYIGILGYSVFGYLEQMDQQENFPIILIVQCVSEWPIHLTLSSTDRLPYEQAYSIAKNYYHLADSQIYMGPNINLKSIPICHEQLYQQATKFDKKLLNQECIKIALSFYVIVYTEDSSDLDIDMVVDLSVDAMKNILVYYNTIPFLMYTVAMEMIKPLDEQHSYGFSMEHLNSCTINVEYGSGINRNSTQTRIKSFQYNIAHHIQHAWLPKRLFSNFYYPFTFELTPAIDTIWFNEVCILI